MVTTRQQRAAQEGRPAGGSSPAPTPSKRRGSTGGGKASSKGSGWASGRTQVFLYYPNLVGTSHPDPSAATAGGDDDEWASEAAKGVEGRMSDVPPLPRTTRNGACRQATCACCSRWRRSCSACVGSGRGACRATFWASSETWWTATSLDGSTRVRQRGGQTGGEGGREGGSDACGCLDVGGWCLQARSSAPCWTWSQTGRYQLPPTTHPPTSYHHPWTP